MQVTLYISFQSLIRIWVRIFCGEHPSRNSIKLACASRTRDKCSSCRSSYILEIIPINERKHLYLQMSSCVADDIYDVSNDLHITQNQLLIDQLLMMFPFLILVSAFLVVSVPLLVSGSVIEKTKFYVRSHITEILTERHLILWRFQ